MHPFPDKLHLDDAGMRGSSRLFMVVALFRVITSKGVIGVPAGFITDGASIPEMFWSILSPFGPWFHAALFHDWGYSRNNTTLTRAEVDAIFKELMFNIGVPWLKRETIYRAVRLFGASSYRGYSA
jgi:hypothetical protein